MASQSSQGASARRVLPVEKFSFATVAAESCGPVPWKHLTSQNDLFVVFDTFEVQNSAGAVEKHQRLKVLHDPEVAEDIDLDVLAPAAQKAQEESQATEHYPRRNPSITIIVKLPCLAMRYPISGGRVRKFQVRFTHDDHYREAIKRLLNANVPINEACAAPAEPSASGFQSQYRAVGSEVQPADAIRVCDTNKLNSLITITPRPAYHQQQNDGISLPEQAQRTIEPGLSNSILSSTEPSYNNTSTISLYKSWPSTAPTILSAHASPDMPPQRELPFLRKIKAKPSLGAVSVTEQAAANSSKRSLDDAGPVTQTEQKKAAIARKKSRNSRPKSISVPSVSELLHKDTQSAQDANATVDTQKLFQRAEAVFQIPKPAKIPQATSNAASQRKATSKSSTAMGVDSHTVCTGSVATSPPQTRSQSRAMSLAASSQATTDTAKAANSRFDPSDKPVRTRKCSRCVTRRLYCDKQSCCGNCLQAGVQCIDPGLRPRSGARKKSGPMIASQEQRFSGGTVPDKLPRLANSTTPALTIAQKPGSTSEVLTENTKIRRQEKGIEVQGTGSQSMLDGARLEHTDDRSSSKDYPSEASPAIPVPPAPTRSASMAASAHEPPAKQQPPSQEETAASALLSFLQDPVHNLQNQGAGLGTQAPPPLAAQAQAQAQDAASLQAFSTLPQTVRDQALETYICSVLDNDKFVGLCRDMDACWARMFVRL